MNAQQKAPAGWYAIFPDGGAWVAVQIDHRGDMTSLIEAATAQSHIAAHDSRAAVCEAIADGETDPAVSADHAAAAIAAYDGEIDPSSCVVERVVLPTT